jgi:hypothetical protein
MREEPLSVGHVLVSFLYSLVDNLFSLQISLQCNILVR